MKASVRWLGPTDTPSTSNMTFQASTESGHQVLMDGAPGEVIGGRNLGAPSDGDGAARPPVAAPPMTWC